MKKLHKKLIFFILFGGAYVLLQAQSDKINLIAKKEQNCFPNTNKTYLSIKQGSAKTTYISAIVNDKTDPCLTQGILFTVTGEPSSFKITSSNNEVVPDSNIIMQQIEGDNYALKIKPIGTGYSTINIKADNGKSSSIYKIKYAASAKINATNSIFPIGISDASGAVSIDENYMFVADDESNILSLYNRKVSGDPLYIIDISSKAGGSGDDEFDIEGASFSSNNYNLGKRIYWIGSLGNGKNGNPKPSRNRIIATDLIGDGANSTLSVKSYSTNLRKAIIAWGDSNSWNFSYSANLIPKRLDGFNVEGITTTNEGEIGYIAFRAPCVPLQGEKPTINNRKFAIIAPINNLERMMDVEGKTTIKPEIGEPILFNLDGLGIRDIIQIKDKGYLILAGLYKSGGIPVLYLWNGKVPKTPGLEPITTASSCLIKLPLDLSSIVKQTNGDKINGFPEAVLCDIKDDTLNIQLLFDNGTEDFYNDNIEAKSLEQKEYKKFQVVNLQYVYTTNK